MPIDPPQSSSSNESREGDSRLPIPVRILLVDDKPYKMAAIEVLLLPLGVEIVRAESGLQALEAAYDGDFAVVLMDVKMPIMDGFETASRLRQLEQHHTTPIIFLSAAVDEELLVKGYTLGAVDFLTNLVPTVLRAKVSVFVDLYRKSLALSDQQRVERLLRAQYSVARFLAETQGFSAQIAELLKIVGESFEWEWTAWWKFSEGTLRCSGDWHLSGAQVEELKSASLPLTLELGAGLPGRVAQSGQSEWIENIRSDDKLPRSAVAVRSGWKSAVGFPIYAEKDLIGVVEGFSRNIRGRNEPMLAALVAIGTHFGRAAGRRRIEARKHAILQASLDCILTIDAFDTIVEWNPAAERTFGHSRAEALGKRMGELIIPARLRAAHAAGIKRLADGGEAKLLGRRIELPALRADGTEFPAEIAIIKIQSDDSLLFTGFVRDISTSKEAEAALHQAKTEAEVANATKDQFLAAVSHELRTPLTPVVALLPVLLENAALPPDVLDDLRMIKRGVDLEVRLIDDLLDLTRITKGKLHLEFQTVDVEALWAAAIETVRGEALAKEISLCRESEPSPLFVEGDPVRLQQVLWNLLKNAVKFTPAGGKIVMRSLVRSREFVLLEVEDSGRGIDPNHVESIFNLFEQSGTPGSKSGGHRFGGLGLGLFISRGIAEAHGGELAAASLGLGHGAKFTFTLPLAAESPLHIRASSSVQTIKQTSTHRILLVEDDPNTCDVLGRLLRRRGHTVWTAGTVAEARELAKMNRIDVLVSDIGLPDGSGLDLMAELKASQRIHGIALSGYGMEADIQKSQTAGFSTHLTKPIKFQALQNLLSELSPAQD